MRGGGPWNVRKDGVPPCFRLGLPSMWFASQEAKDAVVTWVDGLRREAAVDMYPEELAFLVFARERGREA